MKAFQAAVRAADLEPIREIFFSVRSKLTLEDLGICSIQRIDQIHRRAEVGLMLYPHAQRLGLGKEIVGTLSRTALATLPVTEIWAQFSEDNRPAAALFNSMGFQVMRRETVDSGAMHVRNQAWSLYSPSPSDLDSRVQIDVRDESSPVEK